MVLRETGAEPPYALYLVTADPAEGEGMTAAGNNIVEPVPMPDIVRDTVAAFVAEHHVEEVFVKRKRDRANPNRSAAARPRRQGTSDDGPRRIRERFSGALVAQARSTPSARPPRPPSADAKDASPPAEVRPPERQTKNDAEIPGNAASKPEFDLASLPSLDSITAVTDVRAFLAPGVPTDLARAALRRAWAADPAIRDFKGLAENAWDFTDPTAMPGFGALPPGTDIKKMLAQIFGDGEKPAATDAAAEKPAARSPRHCGANRPLEPPSEKSSATGGKEEFSKPEITTGSRQIAQADFVQRDNNTASHNNSSDDD